MSAVWTAAGASEVAVQRLLILGAKWQKGAQAEIYRDPDAVSRVVASPGVTPPAFAPRLSSTANRPPR